MQIIKKSQYTTSTSFVFFKVIFQMKSLWKFGKLPKHDMIETSQYCSHKGDKTQDEKIVEPFMHLLRVPGKKFRAKFCRALNIWLKISQDKLHRIEFFLETCHNASLLIDDIQDNSILRRGHPTVHTVFGVPRTVTSSNFVVNAFMEKLLESEDPKAVAIIMRKCLDLYAGQGMEIYWRENLICPSLDDYKLMCIRKTGGLFLLAIEFMQVYSEVKVDLTKFGEDLALFFQIRDDYMNLCSDEYSKKKSFCDDISEGKFSFPIIHAIQAYPQDKRIIEILKQKPQDYETKKYCLSLLEDFGSIDYTRKVLKKMREGLTQQLEELPENLLMCMLLDRLFHFD